MMKLRKTEKVSLLLVVAAIVGVVILLLIEGRARGWVLLFSFLLFLLSIDPSFSLRRKSSASKEVNRVGRASLYFLMGAGGVPMLYILITTPFRGEINGDYIAVVIYFGFLLLVVVWTITSARGWLSRRLHWLTGNGNLNISKEGRGKTKVLYSDEDADGISYAYRPADKLFYVNRTMYLNPARFEKEYGERKYQFQTRMQQTRIPLYLHTSDCESSISFLTSVMLEKKYATKGNVCRIRDVMRDLAREDFNQHLFTRLEFDDDTLCMELFHYQVVKAMLVSADGKVERYSPQELTVEDDQNERQVVEPSLPPERFVEFFRKVKEEGRIDKLQPADLMEKEEFERIWGGSTLCEI